MANDTSSASPHRFAGAITPRGEVTHADVVAILKKRDQAWERYQVARADTAVARTVEQVSAANQALATAAVAYEHATNEVADLHLLALSGGAR